MSQQRIRSIERSLEYLAAEAGATVRHHRDRRRCHTEYFPGRTDDLGQSAIGAQVDLMQDGEPVAGMEVIGNLRSFWEPTGPDVVSRYYDSVGNCERELSCTAVTLRRFATRGARSAAARCSGRKPGDPFLQKGDIELEAGSSTTMLRSAPRLPQRQLPVPATGHTQHTPPKLVHTGERCLQPTLRSQPEG